MPGRHARCALALVGIALASAAAAKQDAALLAGQRLADCEVTACEITREQTRITLAVKGMTASADERLIRWGEPAAPAQRPGAVLADGSWLLSDRAWSPLGLVRIDRDNLLLRRGRGLATLPRTAIRWVVLDAEGAGLRIDAAPLSPPDRGDEVLLAGGDRIRCQVESLTNVELVSRVGEEPLKTPLERVMALRLEGPQEASRPAVLVGLTGGSLIRAESLKIDAGVARIERLGASIEAPSHQVALIQPLAHGVRYLSDLEPVDYRHTPYLDLTWPYARDQGLRQSPLAGGGARRAKGLAMHSAGRLVYRHDGSAATFRADLAVADPPAGSNAPGSVTFRVYRVQEGEFQPAYESPIVRSGDPTEPIEVDLTGSAALVLVVDFADNGDTGDHALWLDARIEPTRH